MCIDPVPPISKTTNIRIVATLVLTDKCVSHRPIALNLNIFMNTVDIEGGMWAFGKEQ